MPIDVKVRESAEGLTLISFNEIVYKVPKHWFWPQFEQNWEPQTFTFFKKNLIKDTLFLDVGGWVGPTALLATYLGAKKVKVVEPNPSNFLHLLSTQFSNEGFFERWSLINACVSDQRGLTQIGPISGILSASSATSIRKQGAEVISILFEDLILPHEDYSLIKIDIEGAEELIIQDLGRMPHNSAAIWLSIHPPFLSDKAQFFKDLSNLSEIFFLTDHQNGIMDWEVLEQKIFSEEEKPPWGTEWGNFFEVGLLPKHAFDASGSRLMR